MDYLMIDLTNVEDPHIGMEVILLGTDGIHEVTALELSQYGESVSGEVTCVISNRVPRIYIDRK
jgi:alanine racemase